MLQKGVSIATALFGPNHIETLRSEMNLAVSHLRRGDAPRALSMLEGVVAALAKHVADREGAYVYRTALNNLAAAFRAVGRVEDARAALEDCLAATEAEGDAIQEEQARVLENLADVLNQRGDREKAEELARRGMEIWTKLGRSASHVGNVHLRETEAVEARDLLDRLTRGLSKRWRTDRAELGFTPIDSAYAVVCSEMSSTSSSQ